MVDHHQETLGLSRGKLFLKKPHFEPMGGYPDDVRKRQRGVRLIALAAASLLIGTSICWTSAQTPTPISIPFTSYCDTVTIGPDTIMSNPTDGSSTVTLTPGVPNNTGGVSFVNVQSQIVLILSPGGLEGGVVPRHPHVPSRDRGASCRHCQKRFHRCRDLLCSRVA